MELLRLHNLTVRVAGEALVDSLDLRLDAGTRVGVVGPNGAGKSTLLALAAGVGTPDEGSIVRPPGVRTAYLSQHLEASPRGTVWDAASVGLHAVHEAEARLRSEEARWSVAAGSADAWHEAAETFERLGGYRAEADLRETLAAVGFPEAVWDRPVASLSGGERRRVALAAALAGEPDVLILDEPTNHLDVAMRAWLARRLARWHGAVLLVSHDRALLDDVTQTTLFLEGRTWEVRRGAYGRARASRDRALLALQRRDDERRKEAARLQAMAESLARRGDRAAHRRRRQAERDQGRLEATSSRPRAASRSSRMALPTGAGARRGVLVEGRDLTRAGVLHVPYLRIEAGQRVALLGPNGSGKSTLLALLAGEIGSDDPAAELRYADGLRLAYLDQLDRGLDPAVAVVDQLAGPLGDGPARVMLTELGLGPGVWSRRPEELSGGERARAGLAAVQARRPDLLLLDEPGNDLDLHAIEALEHALGTTSAAVVLATHDRRLAQGVATEVWAIEHGSLQRYRDVAAFLAGTSPQPLGDLASAESSPALTDGDTPSEFAGAVPEVADDRSTPLAELELLEDERNATLRQLEDPLLLAPRELDRLRNRIAELDEALASAYDARLPPPEPRFRLRERGLDIYADRVGNDLLLLAAPPERAAEAMDQALRGLRSPEPAARDDTAPWPRALVHRSGGIGHIAIQESATCCLLPWARSCLADGAARFAFTLLDVRAVQLFTRAELPHTRLVAAGDGWWSWTRSAFARDEGLTADDHVDAASRDDRAKGRAARRRRSRRGRR